MGMRSVLAWDLDAPGSLLTVRLSQDLMDHRCRFGHEELDMVSFGHISTTTNEFRSQKKMSFVEFSGVLRIVWLVHRA